MHRRDGRIPTRSKMAQPCEKTCSVETGRTNNIRPGSERAEQAAYKAMNVKQRHHVQACVVARKLQCATDVLCGRAQIRVREWHELTARGGARAVQQQCD